MPEPVFVAVPPVSTRAWSGEVDVPRYLRGGGLGRESSRVELASVDLEVWAQTFFSALDSFLSKQRRRAAARLDRESVKAVANARERLVEALVASSAALTGSPAPETLALAGSALRKGLRVGLKRAYAEALVAVAGGEVEPAPLPVSRREPRECKTVALALGRLGKVEVPIPLRELPPAPLAVEQGAAFAREPPRTLAELRRWRYTVMLEQQAAAQDRTWVALAVNLPHGGLLAPSVAAGPPTPPELAAALARFVLVYPQLADDLARDAEAVRVFAELVSEVAASWRAPQQSAAPSTSPAPAGADAAVFVIEGSARADGTLLGLTIARAGDPPPEREPALPWPDVEVLVAGDAVPLARAGQDRESERATYAYPDEAPPLRATDALRWRLGFELDFADCENAQAHISTRRNEELIVGVPTNPLFVYASPVVTFPTPMQPRLVSDHAIAFGTPGQLHGSLTTLLETLLATASGTPRPVSLDVEYRYRLTDANGQPADEISLPVLHLPERPDATDLDAVATTVADGIETWSAERAPGDRNGHYELTVSVYPSLDATATVPLLTARRLRYSPSRRPID